MTETTPDWGVLARALEQDGVAPRLLYAWPRFEGCGDSHCPHCRETWAHLAIEGRTLRDFTDLAIIVPVANAWRAKCPGSRRYKVSVGYWSRARAEVEWDDEDRQVFAQDDLDSLAEALALALLAWAKAQGGAR